MKVKVVGVFFTNGEMTDEAKNRIAVRSMVPFLTPEELQAARETWPYLDDMAEMGGLIEIIRAMGEVQGMIANPPEPDKDATT